VGGRERLRAQLAQLGLPPEAQVVGLTGLAPAPTLALWDTAALDAEYAALRSQLQRSAAQLQRLPLPEAARESFEVGARAIRALVLDPLLPAPLVDVEARRALAREMERYDELGHALWRRLMFEEPEPDATSEPTATSPSPHEHEPLLQTGVTALLDLAR
jgi:phenylacetic acid degradation operon negative regulatory protein